MFNLENIKSFLSAIAIAVLLFSGVVFAAQTCTTSGGTPCSDTTTLTVTVNTALTFAIDGAGTTAFGTLNPGTPLNATTTLSVSTNDNSGYILALSGDNKSATNSNLQRTGDTTVQITDQTEWVPGAATTTAGNAVTIANLINSGNVLAFRVMSASSTNGASFLATSWWGTTDCFTITAATCLWAGIASSTVSRTIGNAGTGSYSATAHLNTAQYYLNVASTQKTGAYTAPLTYTATGN